MLKFFLILLLIYCSQCELFTSTNDLRNLIKMESHFIKDLEIYLEKQEESLRYLRKKVLSYRVQHEKMTNDVDTYLANPLNAYLLIKRLTADAEIILKAANGPSKTFLESFHSYNQTYEVPTDVDLTGAVLGLLRLQETYHLPTKGLVKGMIYDKKYGHDISTHDCYQVGYTLNREHNCQYAKEWLNEALAKHNDYYDSMEVQEAEIVAELQTSNSPECNKSVTFKDTLVYQKSCRNEIEPNITEISGLKCRYLTTKSKFTILAPFKVEEMSGQRKILLFHNVLSDAEINLIILLSKNYLATSGIENPNITVKEKFQARVSQVAWLHDRQHEKIRKISKRVEDMTDLSVKSAEDLQVQNYGIGGHYNLHVDYHFIKEKIKINGPRVATVLFYLSNVKLGGATVFPYLNIYVPPIKGSAVFWHNLTPSGHGDWHTRHASCPVILGYKWAANKWLHEHHQEFRRPCPLHAVYVPENHAPFYNAILGSS